MVKSPMVAGSSPSCWSIASAASVTLRRRLKRRHANIRCKPSAPNSRRFSHGERVYDGGINGNFVGSRWRRAIVLDNGTAAVGCASVDVGADKDLLSEDATDWSSEDVDIGSTGTGSSEVDILSGIESCSEEVDVSSLGGDEMVLSSSSEGCDEEA